MLYKDIHNYKIYGHFKVTYNPKERTYTIYTMSNGYLSTVNDGELNSELRELEKELYGTD